MGSYNIRQYKYFKNQLQPFISTKTIKSSQNNKFWAKNL
jgi:hypothetical protein